MENYVILSEFENNLRAGEIITDGTRHWSLSPKKQNVQFDTGSCTLPRVNRHSTTQQFKAPVICVQPPEESEPIPVKIITPESPTNKEQLNLNNNEQKHKNPNIKDRICKMPAFVNANWRIISVANNKRPITVIDEASV